MVTLSVRIDDRLDAELRDVGGARWRIVACPLDEFQTREASAKVSQELEPPAPRA